MDNLRILDSFSSVHDSIILLEGIMWSKDLEPDLCLVEIWIVPIVLAEGWMR